MPNESLHYFYGLFFVRKFFCKILYQCKGLGTIFNLRTKIIYGSFHTNCNLLSEFRINTILLKIEAVLSI